MQTLSGHRESESMRLLKPQVEGRHRDLVICLTLISLIAFTPVLVFPHWGLYSDPEQIIDQCRIFFSSSVFRADLVQGYLRPGFHSIDLFLWSLSPNNPLVFYIAHAAVFCLTVAVTYLNCYELCKSRLIAFLTSMSWFAVGPTYEVIYTLDKGESYIALLIALVIRGYLKGVSAIASGSAKTSQLVPNLILVFLASTYAVFTKETGQLCAFVPLVLSAFLVCGSLLFRKSSDRVEMTMFRQQVRWAAAAAGCALVGLGTYKVYSSAAGRALPTYGVLTMTPHTVLSNMLSYLHAVPELFSIIAFCLIGAAFWRATQRSRQKVRWIIAPSFVIVCITATVALCAWETVLVYACFPLFALLLPATAFYAGSMCAQSGLLRVYATSFFLIGIALFMPRAIVQAEFQFKMDASVNQLAREVAALPEMRRNRLFGMGLDVPDEIGERIKMLVLSDLIPNYTNCEQMDKQVPSKFFNVLEYHPTKTTTGTAAGLSVAERNEEPVPHVSAYSYPAGFLRVMRLSHDLSLLRATSAKRIGTLKEGDLVIVPYGNIDPARFNFRGISLFRKRLMSDIAFLPQIEFEPVLNLEQRLLSDFRHHSKFGWHVLRVGKVPRLSWNITTDGWLPQGASIFVQTTASTQTLHLLGHVRSSDSSFTASYDSRSLIVPARDCAGEQEFEIPVPASTTGGVAEIEVQSNKICRVPTDNRPLLIRVRKAWLN